MIQGQGTYRLDDTSDEDDDVGGGVLFDPDSENFRRRQERRRRREGQQESGRNETDKVASVRRKRTKSHYTGGEEVDEVRANAKKTQHGKPMTMMQEDFNDILDGQVKEHGVEDLLNLEAKLPALSDVDETIVQDDNEPEDAEGQTA